MRWVWTRAVPIVPNNSLWHPTRMELIGNYTGGDLTSYAAAIRRMRADIDSLRGTVLVAHHGDADGIIGGGLVGRYLSDRGCRIRYASAPEFRDKDLSYFVAQAADCDAGVFIEAQGMSTGYAALDLRFLNIDHHPQPPDTPIRRMLNPRNHAIEPNPAAGFVCWELLGDALPASAGWLAAVASIVDYCAEAARTLCVRHAADLVWIDDLRDTFLASQYVLPHTTDLADLVSRLPSPPALLEAEPYAKRRMAYRGLLRAGIDSATGRGRIVMARVPAGEYRVASPLANHLQDIHPDKCIIVAEESPDTVRLSVRNRQGDIHLGRILGGIAARMNVGDGTGHEKAGSARMPRDRADEFLRDLEAELNSFHKISIASPKL